MKGGRDAISLVKWDNGEFGNDNILTGTHRKVSLSRDSDENV
jgi:hypothetical protein